MADLTVDQLIVEIKADNNQLKKDLSRLQRDLKREGTTAAKGFGASFKSAIATVGIGIAIKKAFDFAGVAKDAARDAEEISSKFATVFENVGDKAQASANDLANSFDLANTTAKELLGTTGDLLVGFGFTEDKALELSKSVQELAIDVASFSNFAGGAKGASEALTKALLGETESAKSLGIVIRQNTKEFRAEVEQLQRNEGLTVQQAKAQVILAQAYEQSQKAVGDYARTSQSLANSERRFQEQQKETLELLGKETIPVYKALIIGLLELNENFLATTGSVSLFGIAIRGVAIGVTALVGTLVLAGQTLGTLGAAIARFITLDFEGSLNAINTGGDQMLTVFDTIVKTMTALITPSEDFNEAIKNITNALAGLSSETNTVNTQTGTYANTLAGLRQKLEDAKTARENLNLADKLAIAQNDLLIDQLQAQINSYENLGRITGEELAPKGPEQQEGLGRTLFDVPKTLEGVDEWRFRVLEAQAQISSEQEGQQNQALTAATLLGRTLTNAFATSGNVFLNILTQALQTALQIAIAIQSSLGPLGIISAAIGGVVGLASGGFSGSAPSVPSPVSGGIDTSAISDLNTTLQASELNKQINQQPVEVVINLDGQEVGRGLLPEINKLNQQGFNG